MHSQACCFVDDLGAYELQANSCAHCPAADDVKDLAIVQADGQLVRDGDDDAGFDEQTIWSFIDDAAVHAGAAEAEYHAAVLQDALSPYQAPVRLCCGIVRRRGG